MPGVAQVAVIGQPDPKWGETPMALIVPKPGSNFEEKDVLDYCQGKMARYKIPKKVIFTDSLPLTPTGKVKKLILRQQMGTILQRAGL
jgi:acyl-CoA synthetase (AMP-forming)/AMP-acid ligase II